MNCIIAQSGGPTSVINSSVYGLVKANNEFQVYENVYGGLNGIEGILNKKIINLSNIDSTQLECFKNSPASGLGSCRYKLKDFHNNSEEYIKLFEILNSLNIKAFFYVGGNDSMDTTAKLAAYAKENGHDIKFIGIPKTIDNDLMYTDHTPGFGSAAKFIATSTLETYLDSKVYIENGIFIIEAMGRDTGWLAAAGALATINGQQCADLVYLPEAAFCKTKFLEDVRRIFNEKRHVYIVASEGIRDENGNFLAASSVSGGHDNFGHSQLGGVGQCLKNLIIQAGITKRVKALELGVLQRCAMHCASDVDLEEAVMVGRDALKYSKDDNSGFMVSIRRDSNKPYSSSTFLIEANKIANNIKYFPTEWINAEGNNITSEGLDYIRPLISSSNESLNENNLPFYNSFVL